MFNTSKLPDEWLICGAIWMKSKHTLAHLNVSSSLVLSHTDCELCWNVSTLCCASCIYLFTPKNAFHCQDLLLCCESISLGEIKGNEGFMLESALIRMYLTLSPRDADGQVTAERAGSGLVQVSQRVLHKGQNYCLFVRVQLLCSITTAKWGHSFSCLTSIVRVNVFFVLDDTLARWHHAYLCPLSLHLFWVLLKCLAFLTLAGVAKTK